LARLIDLTLGVAFFPQIDVPRATFKSEDEPALPWQQGFGHVVFTDILLAQSPEGTLLLRELIVFPAAMTLAVVAQLRRPLVDGPGTRGHNGPKFRRCPVTATWERDSCSSGCDSATQHPGTTWARG
jgi:hypothetical protein